MISRNGWRPQLGSVTSAGKVPASAARPNAMTAPGHQRRVAQTPYVLAVIMHRIWVDGTEFRWTREAAAA